MKQEASLSFVDTMEGMGLFSGTGERVAYLVRLLLHVELRMLSHHWAQATHTRSAARTDMAAKAFLHISPHCSGRFRALGCHIFSPANVLIDVSHGGRGLSWVVRKY